MIENMYLQDKCWSMDAGPELTSNGPSRSSKQSVSGVIFSVYGRGYFTPGVVALVVTYAAHAGGVLRWGTHLYAHLNPKMVSLERIVTYANELEQEKPHELPSDKIIDSDWPAKGEIEFRNYK